MIKIEIKNKHINIIKEVVTIKYTLYRIDPCFLTYYPKKDRVCLYKKSSKPLWPKTMMELIKAAKNNPLFSDQMIIYILMRTLCK
jgi:hypothetical protein